jgi:uncharacterized protein
MHTMMSATDPPLEARPGLHRRVADLLSAVTHWAAGRADISAVALVGSYARGAATPTSDVDLVLLTHDPACYLTDTAWIACFGHVERQQIEDWGKVTSVRVYYAGGLEVEFGLTLPDWGADPPDEGTRQVIEQGILMLLDRRAAPTAS